MKKTDPTINPWTGEHCLTRSSFQVPEVPLSLWGDGFKFEESVYGTLLFSSRTVPRVLAASTIPLTFPSTYLYCNRASDQSSKPLGSVVGPVRPSGLRVFNLAPGADLSPLGARSYFHQLLGRLEKEILKGRFHNLGGTQFCAGPFECHAPDVDAALDYYAVLHRVWGAVLPRPIANLNPRPGDPSGDFSLAMTGDLAVVHRMQLDGFIIQTIARGSPLVMVCGDDTAQLWVDKWADA